MGIAVAGFDWDEGTWEKCQKHGVSLVEIEEVLSADPRFAPDREHSAVEDRFIAVGRTAENRALFVAFTFRVKSGRMWVRPVTARYMHGKEADRYEEESSQAEE